MKIRADRVKRGDTLLIADGIIREKVLSVETGRYSRNQTSLFVKKGSGNVIERTFSNDTLLNIEE